MIQKGDIVFLIHPENICTLEINKPYRVYHKYHDLIAIEGDFIIEDDYIDNDFDTNETFKRNERYYYYNELRFKKDVRLERKLKLSQISKVRNEIFSSQKT